MNLIFLFLVGCAFAPLFLTHTIDLSAYLDEKLRQSKIDLIKVHIQKTSPVQEKAYNIHWNRLWRVSLTKEHQPFTTNVFDRIFILNGNRVMEPIVNNTFLNNTLTLHEIGRIKQYRTVKFVRSIVWKNTTYVLVCYELYLCSFHTITQDNVLRFRHTIKHRGSSVDAKFFTQRNQLYLIIANNADKSSVPSVIYRWSGTYMDVVDYVMAIGAKSVTAFEYRQSTIIVFAQYDTENPRVGSEVYEFKGKDAAKIQLLFTTQPTLVHHFVHNDINFILVVNEFERSSLLCWAEQELLDWMSLPEVKSHSLINIFHMNGDTFVIVAHENIIQLYKFHSTSDLKSENIKRFKDSQKIVDMTVSLNAYTMNVMLVIKEMDEYWVEQWKVEITSVPIDNMEKDVDSMENCLLEMINVLRSRIIEVQKAEDSWEFLLPSAEDITRTKPVRFDNVILQAGTINNIEITVEEGEDILPPHKIEKAVNEIDRNVDDILSKWQNMIDTQIRHVQNGDAVIDDAFFEDFEINRMNVDFVNDVKQNEIILPEGEQEFVSPLYDKSIFVQDLEVDSLCGIPSRYWTLRNDTTNTITAANGSVEYSRDTITVNSDLTIEKLRANSLNETVIDQLINDLFIINDRQEVKGQITYSKLAIENLTTQMLNGVYADKLMTIATNQSFDNFSTKFLEIVNLHAKTVNGVPVEEAARKSRENFIRGKVNLARLHITKNFTIGLNTSVVIPKQRPLHIYKNVTILGDLHLQNIEVSPFATLFVSDHKMNTSNMFNSFWTKSSSQTITEDVTFEDGLSIDNLNTKYVNGFVESDFLYTTMEEIPSEFINLHFENFHVKDFFLRDDYNTTFFNVDFNETLTINEKLHLRSLQAEDVITLAFNGINVNSIMSDSVTKFSEPKELPAIQARRVLVDNFNLHLLNDHKIYFEEGLRVNDDHELDILKMPEFHVQNLTVERLNSIEMSLLTRLKNLTSSDLSRIVIVGDLTVENLTVNQIGEESTDNFLKKLAQNNITISTKEIENLIARNVTLTSLYGQNFNDFANSVLTKSTTQVVPGHFSARNITSDNITTNYLNRQNISQLMWVNEPLTFTGNVTFTDLIVEGDVITSSLNGQRVSKLYDSLLLISAKDIDLLKVNGSVSWDAPSYSPTSISYLLDKAVTKDGYQDITANVSFEKNVNAWIVTGPFDVTEQIRDIMLDIVVDYGESIEISGSKVFEDDFVADNLKVNGDLGIRYINHVDINEFNNSIVKKYREDTISSPLIFTKDIRIENLYIRNPDLNASIDEAVRFINVLPDNIFFENLVVLKDVYLEYLDNINFEKFVKSRVTLSGNHDVWCDLRFKKLVTVTDKMNLNKINGIDMYNFVLNEDAVEQIITGTKIFEQDVIVEGSVTATRINDKNITMEYDQSVLNDENVDIHGNLIFKEDVQVQEIKNFELVNGMAVHSIISDFKEKVNKTLGILKKNEKIIIQDVAYSSQVYEASHNVFFYLEVVKNPIVFAPNVFHVDVLYLEKTTRLNIYVKQPGNYCELPNDCACVKQLMVEFSGETNRMWERKIGKIEKNFYDPDGTLVNLISNIVSSSRQCTLIRNENEFITIFLTKYENSKSRQIVLSVDMGDGIGGYWRDAKIFKHDGDIYVILAVYYSKTQETHRTNSLLYKVDMADRILRLIQKIPTNGAWSVEILKIDQDQVFLLIGCFSNSSESLLYRFDPFTQQFQQIRTLASRSRYVKSLSQGKDHFILLDNPDANAVNIYKYNSVSRNFYSYQSIFHDRQVNGIELFYIDDRGNSDVFVIITTENGRFYIYEYMFAGKFQMKMQHIVDGLQTMTPFYHMNHQYIFVGARSNSTIFRIMRQGPH